MVLILLCTADWNQQKSISQQGNCYILLSVKATTHLDMHSLQPSDWLFWIADCTDAT